MIEPWNITVMQPAVKPVFKGDSPLRRDALRENLDRACEHVRVAAKSVELPRHVAMLLRDARAFARDQGVDGQGGGYVSDRRLRPTCP